MDKKLVSVEIYGGVYKFVTISFTKYDDGSGLWYTSNRPDTNQEIDLEIDPRDLSSYERFVFVVGHEFGHIQREALRYYKNDHVSRFNNEACADRASLDLFYKEFGYKISKEFLADIMDIDRFPDMTERFNKILLEYY
jgi:hypothetical protein